MKPSHALARTKVQSGLTTLAWVSAEYFKINKDWLDADDYIQTMIILESFVAKNGYDHADLVARFRVDRPTQILGNPVPRNGADHKGQLSKLRASADPMYLAKDGVTSGCAMKSMPMGIWHREFHNTIFMADAVTRVTHGTTEARLVGVLAALRYRHAFLEIDDPEKLVQDWTSAAKMLCLHGTPAWIQVNKAVTRALAVVKGSWGTEALRRLLNQVGLMYFAWSCPVSAIFWSYVLDPAFKSIFQYVGSDKKFTVKGEEILVSNDVLNEYTGTVTQYHKGAMAWLTDPAKTGRQDSDTFFSIAFSIAAVRSYDFLTPEESAKAVSDLGRENWVPVLDALEVRWK